MYLAAKTKRWRQGSVAPMMESATTTALNEALRIQQRQVHPFRYDSSCTRYCIFSVLLAYLLLAIKLSPSAYPARRRAGRG